MLLADLPLGDAPTGDLAPTLTLPTSLVLVWDVRAPLDKSLRVLWSTKKAKQVRTCEDSCPPPPVSACDLEDLVEMSGNRCRTRGFWNVKIEAVSRCSSDSSLDVHVVVPAGSCWSDISQDNANATARQDALNQIAAYRAANPCPDSDMVDFLPEDFSDTDFS